MYLVVDPNVIISAIIKKGTISEIFSLNSITEKFNFIAPNFLVIELGKHTGKIAKKTRFSEEIVKQEIEFVINQITFIPDEEYKNKLYKAKEILKEHKKDVPYLALALAFDCKIFSGDKKFKQLCPDIVRNPIEILNEF